MSTVAAMPAVVVATVSAAAALRPRVMAVPRATDACTDVVRAAPATWPDVLDHVARAIRSGSAVRTAYHDTLARMGAPPSAGDDGAVAEQALAVALALGGPTASVFESAASLLREREAARAEAVAHAAQARLSARVLTAVPLLFTLWSAVTSASFRAALAGPVGAASAAAGIALNVLGWWWMRRIVDRATR